MYSIELTQGASALISDEDVERVQACNWCLHSEGYAVSRIKDKIVYLHRFIMDAADNTIVDHINGNRLDCRRTNLRFVNAVQNQYNKVRHINGSSQYKGVNYFPRTGRWMARIRYDGRQHYLGYFDTEEEAARAYDAAALTQHKEYAKLNFPIKE